MLDNEVYHNDQVKVARRMMMGNMSEGISAMPLESSPSTMSAMPQCPKAGVVVKVTFLYFSGVFRSLEVRITLKT